MSWGQGGLGPVPEMDARLLELADPTDITAHVSGAGQAVVFFTKTGCPYCLAYQTRFADLARERSGGVAFVQVRLDDPRNPLWERYHIQAVPTFVAFARGEIVARADSILAVGLSKKQWSEFCEKI